MSKLRSFAGPLLLSFSLLFGACAAEIEDAQTDSAEEETAVFAADVGATSHQESAASRGDGTEAAAIVDVQEGLNEASKPFVGIPANYVYNPKLGALHDYCTKSPDEFPAPFASNANFRGPCARHDLCYGGNTDKKVCDNNLFRDMSTNCIYEYGSVNPLRYQCFETAALYWAAVVAAN
ncbi:MAG: hypothetical protein RL385_2877 [Pseudomonadota bacterium]